MTSELHKKSYWLEIAVTWPPFCNFFFCLTKCKRNGENGKCYVMVLLHS